MNAQQLKNSILQEAIEGRLVPQDPNDEPASVLLDRIRKEKAKLVKEGKLKKKDLEETPISEDEIPFEIPESWGWCRLKSVSLSITDGDHMPPPKADRGIPFLVISNVIKGYIDFSNTRFVPQSYYDNISKDRKAEKDDVLFTVTGSYGKAILNKSNSSFCFQRHIALVKPLIYPAFVEAMLNSPYIKNECDDKATGMAQKTVGIDTLRSFIVPIPPLAEQKRIVAKIEELLPKVEEYGKAQESLDKLNEELPERLKKSILQEAIEGRLVPQDSNDEPASVLLDKIRAEKKQLVKEGKLKKKDLEETPISENEIPFKIPESWKWCRLGDISTYSHTKKKINATKAAPNIWGLDLEDIEKGGKLLCIKTVGERKAIGDKTCFEEGEILYSKLRPYLLKILIAPQSGICTPEIIPFTCYGNICNNYIVYLLKSVYVDRYINSATFGIKMPRVATETMTSLMIPLPPLAEQTRIVEKIEKVMKEIDKLNV